MLRAFDGIAPGDVRCVILGQDPYPCPAFATGRAFEAGNVARWRELDKMFSPSVRAFIQMILDARTGEARHAQGVAQWPATLAAIEQGAVDLEAPEALADRWVASGVLLLNSSLTLTRFLREGDPHQMQGHLPLWAPLDDPGAHPSRGEGHTRRLPGNSAMRRRRRSRAAGLQGPDAGDERVILRPHPAQAREVLAQENPFALCNRRLRAMGATPVDW